jgi:hypothetical protein
MAVAEAGSSAWQGAAADGGQWCVVSGSRAGHATEEARKETDVQAQSIKNRIKSGPNLIRSKHYLPCFEKIGKNIW